MKNLVSSSVQPLLTIETPSTSPASPSSGDPVILFGAIPAVVKSVDLDDATKVVCRVGPAIARLSVKGVDDFGNVAVSAGDKLYITTGDTVKISKKASGIFYGYAFADSATGMTRSGTLVTSGSTTTIQVLLVQPFTPPQGTGSELTLQRATVTLTNAEIKALRATPKTLVAAPGAGKTLEFVQAYIHNNGGTNALTETADNLGIKFNNGSGLQVSQDIEATGFVDQTASTITNALPKIDQIVTPANSANKALVLHNTGDGEYGGNAANDVTFTVDILYRIRTVS